MQIVALTGQSSVGKGLVTKILVEEYGFKQRIFSDTIREAAGDNERRLIKAELQILGDEYRRIHGPGILVEWMVESEIVNGTEKLIIDGLRCVGEIKAVKAKVGLVVGVDADRELIRELYLGRARPGDDISEEGFERLWTRENSGVTDGEMNIQRCIEMADIRIVNEGNWSLLGKARELGLVLRDREVSIRGERES